MVVIIILNIYGNNHTVVILIMTMITMMTMVTMMTIVYSDIR